MTTLLTDNHIKNGTPRHTAALEADPIIRDAVARWWFWALRFDCSSEWDHTISRLQGALAGHPHPAARADLRFLLGLAEEHSQECYDREHADFDALFTADHTST